MYRDVIDLICTHCRELSHGDLSLRFIERWWCMSNTLWASTIIRSQLPHSLSCYLQFLLLWKIDLSANFIDIWFWLKEQCWMSWCSIGDFLRAAPLVLSIWPCQRKLDEEESKHAGLAHQNGFWPGIFAQDAGAGNSHSKAYHLLLIG